MKLYNVPSDDLRSIVLEVSQNQYNGNLRFNNFDPRKAFVNFTLRVSNSKGKGAKNSASGRRTVSACWCAHRAVMRVIFDRFPNARLVSAIATYNGKADFDQKHIDTRYHNVGSIMYPATMGELCEAC